MQDLIKESASELKNMLYESKEDKNSIEHVDMGYKEFIDWHNKQMEKVYKKGRSDERKENIGNYNAFNEKLNNL